MSARDLFTVLNQPGSTFFLSGDYIITKPLIVTKSLTLTGDAVVKPTYSAATGYAIRFDGAVNRLSGFTYDALLKTCGVRVTGDAEIGFGVKNTLKRGTSGADAVNGIEVVDATRLLAKDFTVENIWASGLAVTRVPHVKIMGGSGLDCCQYYPSGGHVYIDGTCRDVLVDGFKARGDTRNDGVYCGTSTSPIPGAIVQNCDIELNHLDPATQLPTPKVYEGDCIKLYAVGGKMIKNKVKTSAHGYGLSDWGTNNIIQDNDVDGGSHGVGLFGSSTVPVWNRIVNSPKPYDNNGRYTVTNPPATPPPPTDPCAGVKAELSSAQAQLAALNTQLTALSTQNATMTYNVGILQGTVDGLRDKLLLAKSNASKLVADLA